MNPSIHSCKKDKKIKKSIHQAIRNLWGPGTASFFAENTHLHHFAHLHLFVQHQAAATYLRWHFSMPKSIILIWNHWCSITTYILYHQKGSRIFQLNRRFPPQTSQQVSWCHWPTATYRLLKDILHVALHLMAWSMWPSHLWWCPIHVSWAKQVGCVSNLGSWSLEYPTQIGPIMPNVPFVSSTRGS